MDKLSSQYRAPLFEEILRYSSRPLKAFHTPGHKAGSGMEQAWLRPELLGRLDLTEIPAFDWEGSLAEAECLAAGFYHADRSFFLVQGASQGILGLILGVFKPGDKVLVARDCHSSVIHAIILADLIPIFLEPDFLRDWGIPAGVPAASLQLSLTENPDCKGLIVTNPTYQGIAGSLAHYREILGERLLIVDEAHGGYFEWSGLKGFDAWQYADGWVQGTHKMLGSLTQTGMLHLRCSRIDPEAVKRSLALISTTSPSYILLASLDSNRRFLATKGQQLFTERVKTVLALKEQISATAVRVLNNVHLQQSNQTVDPWKLCLSFNRQGLSGYQAESILRGEFGIQSEYADLNQVTFFIAPWQSPEDLALLHRAIVAISARSGGKAFQSSYCGCIPPLCVSPRKAALGLSRWLKLEQATGFVSADIISPYPPGIPLIEPGELIREQEVRLVKMILSQGGIVHGASADGEVRVLIEPYHN